MTLRTTFLIDRKSLNLLQKAAFLKKKTHSEIICAVIKETVKKFLAKNKLAVTVTVKYQNRIDDYIVHHYSVNSDLYEACLDLRKFYKLSVSRILNEAIKDILSGALGESECNPDRTIPFFATFFSIMDNYKFKYDSTVKIDSVNNEFAAKIRMKIT